MNPPDVLLVICLALGLVGLIFALVSWRAGMGTGRVLEGIGLVAAAIGLFLSGLMQLFYDLLLAIATWARETTWDLPHLLGVGALVLAIVLWLVAGSFNRRGVGVLTAEERRVRREERHAAKQARKSAKGADGASGRSTTSGRSVTSGTSGAGSGAGSRTGRAGSATGAKGTGAGSPADTTTDDFAEIEDILKKRGIN